MEFTSYTLTNGRCSEIKINSEEYKIPDEARNDLINKLEAAKSCMGKRVEWDWGLSFEFTENADGYQLLVYYKDHEILVSYGITTEEGWLFHDVLNKGLPEEIVKDKLPIVCDCIIPDGYAIYLFDMFKRGTFNPGATGTLTTAVGLLTLERK